jgi:hypothetical protein
MQEEVVCNGAKTRIQVVKDRVGEGTWRERDGWERICVHSFLDLGYGVGGETGE